MLKPLLSRSSARFAGALLLASLGGCSGGVLDPQGPIGGGERLILLDSLAIMLVIVVPTIAATLAFSWWFRSSNTRARHLPDWAYSGRLEFIVWAIPALVVMFLGGIAWIGSHDLDPYAPIQSKNAPLEIEVVSLDWKWLFIYPDQHIASVNRMVIPVGTPVHFRLTSGTVMNSFFIPQLGSQIYTMAGMTSQLSLQADAPGIYSGRSVQFSGDGFSDMHFEVQAMDAADFATWTDHAKASPERLDTAAYKKLLQPSVQMGTPEFGNVDSTFFETVLRLPDGSDETHAMNQMNSPTSDSER